MEEVEEVLLEEVGGYPYQEAEVVNPYLVEVGVFLLLEEEGVCFKRPEVEEHSLKEIIVQQLLVIAILKLR